MFSARPLPEHKVLSSEGSQKEYKSRDEAIADLDQLFEMIKTGIPDNGDEMQRLQITVSRESSRNSQSEVEIEHLKYNLGAGYITDAYDEIEYRATTVSTKVSVGSSIVANELYNRISLAGDLILMDGQLRFNPYLEHG